MSTDEARSILVVVPTLNEVRTIAGVIEALREDLPKNAEVTMVVADGGSTDGTIELVRKLSATNKNIRYLHNPQRIQSAGVNLAARTAGRGHDVLIRCDAHAIYPPGFIRHLVETLDATQADAVVVPMDSVGGSCVQNAVAWVSDSKVGSGGSAHRGGKQSGFVDHGHHAAFRMESFQRVGGYDETFTHNEDAELDCRQRAVGGKIWLESDIRIAYHPRDTLTKLARQYFQYGRGRSRTVRKHPGSLRARQLAVPMNAVLCVLALALSPLVHWFALLPAMYVLALATTSLSISIKHRSVCGLLAGPAAFVMHNAWALGFLCGFAFIRERTWSPRASAQL
ncbi:MAG: succinoglycan biosynthesis protein exoa [Rhizobacter sp.]|nr:succinoglycan biosynthesis protein exoa [Rhizobacter sp.]